MTNKRLVNLSIPVDIIEFYTKLALEDIMEEDGDINQQAIQRRRARLIIDVLIQHCKITKMKARRDSKKELE